MTRRQARVVLMVGAASTELLAGLAWHWDAAVTTDVERAVAAADQGRWMVIISGIESVDQLSATIRRVYPRPQAVVRLEGLVPDERWDDFGCAAPATVAGVVEAVESGQATRLRRDTARVVPVNELGQVLVAEGWDPAHPEDIHYFSIGGGIDPGEDARMAAVRELREEAGVVGIDAADLVALGAGPSTFSHAGFQLTNEQEFFAVRVPASVQLSRDGMDETELASTSGLFWVSPDEVAAHSDGDLAHWCRRAIEAL